MIYLLAAFDMDGTLLEEDSSWVALHKQFGTLQKGNESLELYSKGLISYEEFMRRDIESWPKNLTRKEVESILSRYRIRKEAFTTIREIKKKGIEPVIITSGIDILASKVAKDLGIRRWYANKLIFDESGFLLRKARAVVEPLKKDELLISILRRKGISRESTIAVGDTVYDIPMLKVAGIGFLLSDEETKEPNIIRINRLDSILDYI